MPRLVCKQCGLPVVASGTARGGDLFCCYGCYLVSRIVGAPDEQGPHAWNVLRLSVGALLAMNVMMISLLLYTGSVEPQSEPAFRWILLALSAPAMAILGYPFAAGALGEIARRRLSLDTLIAVGSFAAFGVSACQHRPRGRKRVLRHRDHAAHARDVRETHRRNGEVSHGAACPQPRDPAAAHGSEDRVRRPARSAHRRFARRRPRPHPPRRTDPGGRPHSRGTRDHRAGGIHRRAAAARLRSRATK